MTLYHFNLLDENEKVAVIQKRGVQVSERFDTFHHILLYQLDAFYVEVFHHTHFNVITRMHAFFSQKKLEPYVRSIDLSGLLSTGILLAVTPVVFSST